MTKITLELENVDEAIALLGALVQIRKGVGAAGPKRPAVASSEGQAGAAVAGTPAAEGGAPAASSSRKPRSDKGQPRGPYKPRRGSEAATAGGPGPVASAPSAETRVAVAAEEPTETNAAAVTTAAGGVAGDTALPATDPSKAADQAANSTSTSTTLPPAAAVPSVEDCQKAVERVFSSKPSQKEGIQASLDCLRRVGADKVRNIKPELRQQFIDVCNEAAPAK